MSLTDDLSQYGGIAPFFAESTWTVTEYRPYELQRHEGVEDTMAYDLTFRIEDLGGGRCRVTQTTVLEPVWYLKPAMALLWPLMMRKRTQAAMDATAQNYKRAAEAALD